MTGPGGSSVILPVDISLSGASYLCIIGAPNRQPPYRIDNRQAVPWLCRHASPVRAKGPADVLHDTIAA